MNLLVAVLFILISIYFLMIIIFPLWDWRVKKLEIKKLEEKIEKEEKKKKVVFVITK